MGIGIEPGEKACYVVLRTWHIKGSGRINEVVLVVDEDQGNFFAVLVRWGEAGVLSRFCEFLNTRGIRTFKSILDTEECRCGGWIDRESLLFPLESG